MALKKKEKKIIEILKLNAGNVSWTCKAMNISRETFYILKRKNEDFFKAVEEVNESLIDLAESKLMENIKKNDTVSTIFFLKTKGKNRGYIERTEIEHSDSEDIKKSNELLEKLLLQEDVGNELIGNFEKK